MPSAAEVLRPVLPAVADEVIPTIGREIPAYERPMESVFGQMVRLGVETALGRFVDGLEGRQPAEGPVRDTYINLGRGEFHAGRSLENLLAAYRIGARVTWRRFVEAGTAGGLSAEELFDVGEAIFAYIDTLSLESAEGYAREQRAEAGERRRARGRLVELLAADAPEADIAAAATEVGWETPRGLAALVVAVGPEEDVEEAADRLARDIGPGVVATAREGVACAFVGDPLAPGRRRLLVAAVGERTGVLGPVVAQSDAERSLRRAVAALRLAGPGLSDADDHLASLLLRADPELAGELAAARLRPLESAPKLEPTLRAWLDRPGQVQAVAHALGVHPQTVRYRMRQLRDLFGPALDDPDARFELLLALRARRVPLG
jgi:PucR-like helix-turn-helix protein